MSFQYFERLSFISTVYNRSNYNYLYFHLSVFRQRIGTQFFGLNGAKRSTNLIRFHFLFDCNFE